MLLHLTLNDVSMRVGNGDWVHEDDKVMPFFAGFFSSTFIYFTG
ncbi:hypothetical protein OL548_04785 [Lysinibacillus sp. MHQ-1]|nr:hypothetical protein OL548_04785 [Lysinibacillus sp. MHQ-1]